MKILVTGVGGQLGHDVINELAKRGCESIGSDILNKESIHLECSYVQLDITDRSLVEHTILSISPDAVIHCAAWTNVDLAEINENREKVFTINVYGTKNIAAACKKCGCKLMYISTDYVFNGDGIKPWTEDCKDYAPLNAYGESKLQGELEVAQNLEMYFIVRVAWVFGKNGNNFVNTMLKLGKKFDTLRVVNDQIGTPTYSKDLARLLVDIIETDKYGYYHATNEGGFISWYDFACEIFRQVGYHSNIIPVTTEEYGLNKAKRPLNSRLDKSKIVRNGFNPLPEWKDAVKRYLSEIQ